MDTQKTVEEMAADERERLQTTVDERISGDMADIHSAMLIVADDDGVSTHPYVAPDQDSREMAMWMLGAFMAHVADAASGASGRRMHPMEAAEWADELMREYRPDERGVIGNL